MCIATTGSLGMSTSEGGLHALEQEEGKRNTAYQDTRGIWTIGVGHTGLDVHAGLIWTDEQVDQAFRLNVRQCEDAINGGVCVPLSQRQFDALVSFVFNVGVGAFLNSTLRRKLNTGCDYPGASAEFMRWVIPSELLGRRERERAMFDGVASVEVAKPFVTTKVVQTVLGVAADGIYGPRTHAAVLQFQSAHGLVVDGIVGPCTLAAMGL